MVKPEELQEMKKKLKHVEINNNRRIWLPYGAILPHTGEYGGHRGLGNALCK